MAYEQYIPRYGATKLVFDELEHLTNTDRNVQQCVYKVAKDAKNSLDHMKQKLHADRRSLGANDLQTWRDEILVAYQAQKRMAKIIEGLNHLMGTKK